MIFLKAGCFFFNEDFLKIPMEKILLEPKLLKKWGLSISSFTFHKRKK